MPGTPLEEARFVVFDVETTGLSLLEGDDIIELGAVAIEGTRYKGRYEQLVDPGRPIQKYACWRVHGITDAMVKGRPTLEGIIPGFLDFLGDAALVAHDAIGDVRLLAMARMIEQAADEHAGVVGVDRGLERAFAGERPAGEREPSAQRSCGRSVVRSGSFEKQQ